MSFLTTQGDALKNMFMQRHDHSAAKKPAAAGLTMLLSSCLALPCFLSGW